MGVNAALRMLRRAGVCHEASVSAVTRTSALNQRNHFTQLQHRRRRLGPEHLQRKEQRDLNCTAASAGLFITHSSHLYKIITGLFSDHQTGICRKMCDWGRNCSTDRNLCAGTELASHVPSFTEEVTHHRGAAEVSAILKAVYEDRLCFNGVWPGADIIIVIVI